MTETVTVGIASFAEREWLLYQALRSLLPQVDRICVYLNGYPEIPEFVRNPKMEVASSDEHGERGDAGKFFWADRMDEGYFLTCDDDLIYAPGYVERIIEGIERYDRRAPVGLHGGIFAINARSPYQRMFSSCLARSMGDFYVHCLGTGVMGYHTSTWQLSPDFFRSPNMADIWLARHAQEVQQPLICIQHERNWVVDLDPVNTIFDNSVGQTGTALDTFSEQCTVVQEIEWRLHTVDGRAVPCL